VRYIKSEVETCHTCFNTQNKGGLNQVCQESKSVVYYRDRTTTAVKGFQKWS